ncbi:MAG: gluconate 2-dehydrogenase subunit 3 family protein [Gemmatimonadetes bacterium]|nr:gluconate 2-dehydrogenase subunit 3 family protein [Gemmatimonadota bacterium]
MTVDRRSFVKTVGAALPVVALPACAPQSADPARAARTLDPVMLRALAEATLPSEVDAQGRESAVAEFERWLAEYRAVVERDHGYGTGELTYTGPDPAPGWRAQLEALDLEAKQRFGRGFADLDVDVRQRLVRAQLRREGEALPEPAEASHVALGLVAWWFGTSAANDLCHGAQIGRGTCRPLERAGDEPAPIAQGA